jgi:transcriptional regulator with XRE-family HTH domain
LGTSSWRELLRTIISVPSERNRIAEAAGVRSITLTRWSNDDSRPRPENLRQLVRALPTQYRRQFQELLEEEEQVLSLPDEETIRTEEIPFNLVDEILQTRATTPDSLRFWAVSRMVLQHALRHLDPESSGMAITVVLCMPPAKDGKIHSLHERAVYGTPPWNSESEHQLLFLGAESLAGYVVATSRPAAIQNLLDSTNYIPSQQGEHEVSAAGAPFLFAGRIAGCLLFSSTSPDYFDESCFPHIQTYTNLMTLALDPENFYPPSLIDLRIMPSLQVQQTKVTDYQQRVQQILRESLQTGQPISFVEAEQIAWQHLEEALLNLAIQTELKDTANR